MFEGRTLVIATKHHKEQAIAPVMEQAMGVRCVVAEGLETDELGTFSGEIERTLNPLSAAKEKCRRALAHSPYDLAIANEGSFGPHPALFMIPADEEILFLIDTKNQWELPVRTISTETNFARQQIQDEEALLAFAKAALFPSHALILRPFKDAKQDIVKGIQDETLLLESFRKLKAEHDSVYAETDMRALYNPSRMKVIEDLTQQLVARLQQYCPECGHPGFGVVDVRSGLPCGWCGQATSQILAEIWACPKCSYKEEHLFPKGQKEADPGRCDYCNP